jgi:hypothetical protein
MKMTRFERRWAHAALDAMFPRNAHPKLPLGAADLDVDGYLDDLAEAWPLFAFLGLRAAFALISFARIVVLRTFRSYHRLTLEQRVRVLDAMYASSNYIVRGAVVLVKATGGIFYGSEDAVRLALAPGHPPLATLRRKEAVS